MPRLNFAEFRPWTGMAAGMGAAIAHHQFVSDALRFDCHLGRANTLVGAAALLVIAIGAWISWRALRAEPDPESSRHFVARLSLMMAALSALLVVWMTIAGWFLPPCA